MPYRVKLGEDGAEERRWCFGGLTGVGFKILFFGEDLSIVLLNGIVHDLLCEHPEIHQRQYKKGRRGRT